jgi:hypothetical protein
MTHPLQVPRFDLGIIIAYVAAILLLGIRSARRSKMTGTVFCICSAIFIGVSLMTPPPSPEKIDGLTWSNPLAVLKQERFGGLSDTRLVAGVLLLSMCVLYAIFR